jgi:hypothetical protein
MEHIPYPFGISTLAILGPILVHSSVTTSQNSSDLVSYAISKAPSKHQQQATRRANALRKIGSENLTLGDDRAHEIASRVQDTRTSRFEMDFKTLIKKLGNREKIIPQRHDKRNTPKSHRLTLLHRATQSILPFPLSPNVMYSLVIIGVRLENHLRSQVMCREQPEWTNQKPSMPPICKIKTRVRVSKRLNTGLVQNESN